MWPAEGQTAVANGCGLDTGEVLDALEQFAGKTIALFQCGIAFGGQREARAQDVIGLKSQIDSLQSDETANRQPGADEQHRRQRHLRDHQHRARSPARRGARTSRLVFERLDQARTRQLERGSQTEQDSGEHRDDDAEQENVAVDLNSRLVGHVKARHKRPHQAGNPDRKQQTEQASQQRNQQTFRQQLPHQLPSSGADRKADRHFARPRRRPGELEVGDIGASDQQQESDGAKEQLQAALHLATGGRDIQIVGKPRGEIVLGKPGRIRFGQLQMKGVQLLFGD